MKTLQSFASLGVIVLFLFTFGLVAPVQAVTPCDFARDLDLGIDGEDVRCLQKYLNGAGFTIAASGVGSPGNETSLFRDLTKEAVAKWQAANSLSPAGGYFGPLSREKYKQLVTGATTQALATSGSKSVAELNVQLASLLQQVDTLKAGSTSQTASPTADKTAREAILKALRQIKDSEDEIDDADGIDLNNANNNLDDAKEDMFDAVNAYFKGDISGAVSLAGRAYDNAIDAFEDAGGETEEDEIDDLIDGVEDQIDEAWEEIEVADDDGEDVDEAEELLEKAEDRLEAAKDANADKDYDEAEKLAEEAEDLVDDAIDAIGENSDEDDAEEAIEDAEDALADAWDEVEEADDDGEDVGDAEDLLEEAEDVLADAQDEFDDENYDEAIDLADEAQDLIDEALDEL